MAMLAGELHISKLDFNFLESVCFIEDVEGAGD